MMQKFKVNIPLIVVVMIGAAIFIGGSVALPIAECRVKDGYFLREEELCEEGPIGENLVTPVDDISTTVRREQNFIGMVMVIFAGLTIPAAFFRSGLLPLSLSLLLFLAFTLYVTRYEIENYDSQGESESIQRLMVSPGVYREIRVVGSPPLIYEFKLPDHTGWIATFAGALILVLAAVVNGFLQGWAERRGADGPSPYGVGAYGGQGISPSPYEGYGQGQPPNPYGSGR